MEPITGNRERPTAEASGYASEQYANSLREFGEVLELPGSRAWLLTNEIPHSEFKDGMGGYPIFSCRNWRKLKNDIDSLAADLISVRIVTDPFADVAHAELHSTFPDICNEYKRHFITDLSLPLEHVVSSHHRRNIRKALQHLDVIRPTVDGSLLRTWEQFYDNLIGRHEIRGIAKFSSRSFAIQASVPGFVAFSALHKDVTCGMTLWYQQGDVAYYHLGAYSATGYELRASYALFWHALDYFAKEGLRFACLGAGAGVNATQSGLTRFKEAWATDTRPVYFCGRIFQPSLYDQLACRFGTSTDFFPAYRAA